MPAPPNVPGPDGAPPPLRGPLQGLEDLSDFVSEHPVHTATFLRGLTIGALVGAAIAGLSIWRRIRHDREQNRPDE